MPVADEVLLARLREVLKTADFEKTTEKMIRRGLEEEFGEDLTDRKMIIRQQIDEFLAQQQDEEDEEEEEDEGDASARGSGLGSQLSPALAEFLGVSSMPRTQVVKKIWEYIKEHNLQDPKNKRRILLDDKLETVFTAPMDMFNMNKQLSRHVYTDEPAAGSSKPRARAKPKPKAEKRAAAGDKQQKGSKKQKREGGPNPNNAFNKPLMLSEELAAFVGQPAMARGQVVKFFWAYFKDNGLQDPSDKRKILSDSRLQQLLGVKSFLAFGLNKFLKDHFKGPATGEAAAAAIAAMQAAAGGSAAATSADSDAEAADDSSDFEDEAV